VLLKDREELLLPVADQTPDALDVVRSNDEAGELALAVLAIIDLFGSGLRRQLGLEGRGSAWHACERDSARDLGGTLGRLGLAHFLIYFKS